MNDDDLGTKIKLVIHINLEWVVSRFGLSHKLIVIFLSSIIDDKALLSILDLPILVVLDEAHIEFSGIESRMQWVKNHENLIILRTFSKRAGIYLNAYFTNQDLLSRELSMCTFLSPLSSKNRLFVLDTRSSLLAANTDFEY